MLVATFSLGDALLTLLELAFLFIWIWIAVDKNSTVVFPAPLMSTIQELGAFLARETNAAGGLPGTPTAPADVNGALAPT